jgi:hypothetical protein
MKTTAIRSILRLGTSAILQGWRPCIATRRRRPPVSRPTITMGRAGK